jgi:hypothetical protein
MLLPHCASNWNKPPRGKLEPKVRRGIWNVELLLDRGSFERRLHGSDKPFFESGEKNQTRKFCFHVETFPLCHISLPELSAFQEFVALRA